MDAASPHRYLWALAPDAVPDASHPGALLTEEMIFAIKQRSDMPTWHACVRGPIPIGAFEPLRIQLDWIVAPTEEEALAVVRAAVYAQCQASSYAYDEDEWEVLHLLIENGS